MAKNKYTKIILFALIVILVIFLNNKYGISEYLSKEENLMFLKDIVNNNLPLALIIYIILTILGCVILAVPGVTFALFAGIIFGPWLGTFACLIATTIGAAMAFLVGRFFLKDSLKPMIEKNKTLKK